MNEDNMFNEQLEDKDQKVVVDMINIQELMLKKLVKISFDEYKPTQYSKQPYAPKRLFNPKNKISISMNGYRLKKLQPLILDDPDIYRFVASGVNDMIILDFNVESGKF